MSGMELYARFMLTVAFGLFGLGVVLVTLFETILRDWDPVMDLSRWWRYVSHRHASGYVRAEDILSDLEGRRRRAGYAARQPIDRRREELRELREAERRASSPAAV